MINEIKFYVAYQFLVICRKRKLVLLDWLLHSLAEYQDFTYYVFFVFFAENARTIGILVALHRELLFDKCVLEIGRSHCRRK